MQSDKPGLVSQPAEMRLKIRQEPRSPPAEPTRTSDRLAAIARGEDVPSVTHAAVAKEQHVL
jgi:hypothetical protein